MYKVKVFELKMDMWLKTRVRHGERERERESIHFDLLQNSNSTWILELGIHIDMICICLLDETIPNAAEQP